MLILQLCCVAAIEGMDMGLLPAVNLALQQDRWFRSLVSVRVERSTGSTGWRDPTSL